MHVPATWTGSDGHYLHQPDVPQHIHTALADLIVDLEAMQVDGLAMRRADFRDGCRLTTSASGLAGVADRDRIERRILEMRFELLVGLRLSLAGLLNRM